MSKDNIFKQLQKFFFSEILAPIVVKFHIKHDRIPGFQNCNIRSGQEFKMVAVAKNSKNNKINSSPEPLDIVGYKFAWNITGTLIFKIVKINKNPQQNQVTVTYIVFTSPVAFKCQYLKKT